MTPSESNTRKQWRVQVKAKTGNWINKGLYETRKDARARCRDLRGEMRLHGGGLIYTRGAYGFGNTRVVRYIKGVK